MAESENEKETLNSKLADSQAKMLRLEEKERQWEDDVQLLRNSETELKVRLAAKESELQSKNAEKEIHPTGMVEEVETKSLSMEMS